MNRKEFLRQLGELLSDVQENERREALEYYENYFEDAGPENEAKIIEELGSPRKVADSIKKDLFGENYREATEDAQQGAYNQQNYQSYVPPKENKTTRNILIAVIIVLTFPVWIGIVGGLFGIIVGLLGAIFGIVVAAIAVVFASVVVGFVLTGVGLVKVLTGMPAVGCIAMAIGLFMVAIGILGVFVAIWCAFRFFPWFIRGIVTLGKKILQRLGVAV